MNVVASILLLVPAAFADPASTLTLRDATVPAPQPELLAPGFPITDPNWEPQALGVGHKPGTTYAFDSPTVLFVNFDGPLMKSGCGNDSQNDCSTIFGGTQFEPSPADQATRAAIIQATRDDVEDFGVIVVGERPPAGNPYAMVVVGTPAGGAPGGIGGVAPGIDCGNTNPNITSFSFLVGSGSNVQATVIHQEAAHTWGLEHVDDPTDNLYPTAGGTTDPKYRDTCSRVVSNTELDPTNASCNQIHTLFCESNFQNSYREMLELFGGPILDTTAPFVAIDNPLDGQILDFEEDFDLTITLDDDRRPQVLDTRILLDGVEEASTLLVNSTLSFGITGGASGHNWANGPHTIRVETEDEAGNPAVDEITVTIEGAAGDADSDAVDSTAGSDDMDGPDDANGDGTGDANDETGDGSGMTGDDRGGSGCRTTPHLPSGPRLAWLALGLLGLARRRA